jgi:DNA-binding MarR family transcriptional regulator
MSRENKTTSKPFNLASMTTYQAGVLQASAHRNLQRNCDEVLRQYELTTMQWLIIGSIYNAKGVPLRLTDLAAVTGTGLPYITSTLNYLEEKRIITRKLNNEDSRSKIIFIADDYIEQLAIIEKDLRKNLRETLYENIDAQDFNTYIKVIVQLADIKKANIKGLAKNTSASLGYRNA